jgi:general secretion pathway protein E
MQGFVGRAPISELLVMSAPLREAVHQSLPTESIREAAEAQGMVPLLLDGLRLAKAGETSLTEILRVAG